MLKEFPQPTGLYHSQNEHENCGIGFVAHIKGKASRDIVERGFEVLRNLDHRGARGADNVSGDGAGILVQVPHDFIREVLKVNVLEAGTYGTGLLFMPKEKTVAEACLRLLKETVTEEGLSLSGVRDVPVNSSVLGEIARSTEPLIKQIFIEGKNLEPDELERRLYIIRKMTEKKIRHAEIPEKEAFYIVSLSSKTMVYKGMFTPDQLRAYFQDLQHPLFQSAIALVHSRFSTNTFPTWALAQPFRLIAHNGEINTIKGNRLWTQAREGLLKSEIFGDELEKILPILEEEKSDSASFDNVLEFLHMTGRSLEHALCMMIPESFNKKNPIPESLKAFYEYHSTIMEPWDGPAAMIFSDGRYIGGTLDRNGLRPARYVITKDDLIIMASETGVQEFAPEEIVEKGRLRPGKILLVDTRFGIIIPDEEVKEQLSHRNPYSMWLKDNRLLMSDILVKKRVPSAIDDFPRLARLFSYTKEETEWIIKSMAETASEPVSSMGNDTPPAVFSQRPQRLFNYFKQIFAQVTNPAIDPIREGLVMSLTNYIGSVNSNILSESPDHCRLIKFTGPVITNTDLGKIKDLKDQLFSHAVIPMLFPAGSGPEGFRKAFDAMLSAAEKAVDDKKNFIILSDRGVSKTQAPFPSLLAVAAVHHHLIKKKKRMQVGIIVETGEVCEVNHFALLLGYGASVVNPYLAFGAIDHLVKAGKIPLEYAEARRNYIHAVDKGLLKIFSKMGISTIRSYHGAQIFEALGISKELADKYFTGTASPLGGIGMEEIYEEYNRFHVRAYEEKHPDKRWLLENTGKYAWRKDGEGHAWNPETIALLQWAARTNNYEKYKAYSRKVDEYNRRPAFIRGCWQVKKNPIPLEQVEPVENIMKRFVTGAMSYGSISKEAHEAIAVAMNTIGGRSNTGEGGEETERFGTDKQSAVKQVASGRFGVTANYLVHAAEIQIKVAQGAKPGEGGQLPGYKVNQIIAKTRHSTPGITLISPPPHHDIYSIEDLAQLIYDLRVTNPQAKISVKLVSENGVGTIAAGVAKARADLIILSGGEGGTGASPVSSIRYAGLPVEMGIAETQQTLVLNRLRGRVKLQVDGQLKNAKDVVKMALLGAEEFGFATSVLIVLGCVMMRKCHLNTCPMGIATQDEKLRKNFSGKPEHVVNFFRFLAEEIREQLAEMGFTRFDDIIGRTDLLEPDPDVLTGKIKRLDFSSLLTSVDDNDRKYNSSSQEQILLHHLDLRLIEETEKALRSKEKVWLFHHIKNTDRAVGAMLSGEISKKYGEKGLPEDTIHVAFSGSAGQSFGAFLAKGITFRLEGDANDYLGKGLSGGKIIVVPPRKSVFKPEKNIIIGNSVFYGATAGEAYIEGVAGERFCVRNSGVRAVIEGTGDHCCEYMTGGRVVVLGKTGRNFAAGMSGGVAYVLDENHDFAYYCNKGLVDLLKIDNMQDVKELQDMINKHLLYTQSSLAARILTRWDEYLPKFVKVVSFEYRKILEEEKLKQLEEKLKQAEDNPARHE
ncbi:glutamate synthase large subunit [Candidatus Sulfidibacterium hydrothermale]|uniref:glutamate synthase large subunit n=1 Tax=Candidatus Sulfidibacterium hydrothermale TaxID=2875962 RepID=UPI001F0B69B3|nr:glutamate synthase large subunit [Candidatus Sulfidibacterium hydrothermale]UBM62407.1 glutamate synthase large subunit [Candidatus Sulfidibacterium hydrothermale]